MTEEQHIGEIFALRNQQREIPAATFDRIEAALAAYPRSARLWCIRGDCIQLGADDSPYSLGDALASYERALEIDGTFAEAHEGIGYYFDVVSEDLAKAETAFATAVKFGGGPHSYYGLARVLAERGRDRKEVLALIDAAPDQNSPVIHEIRAETLRGEWERKKEKPNQAAQTTPGLRPSVSDL